ncbi:unnamed protein product [Leptidea sinapis]|uniref:Uncharacterized protein n=1 Tax=Leptidea sinapis TaxID=189913 RepID=A0A5E4QHF4_9NEOP|nr:unnamed protein product [Leptidea sinapis]
MAPKKKIDYRDISDGLKKLRDFLLGRKHNLHGRFMPFISPRSIPPAEIPRCPEYKYSNQYYHKRNVFHSVHPPIVAPIAEGPPLEGDPGKKSLRPECLCFPCPPTPGPVWWWDGHCYYETVPDSPVKEVAVKSPEPPCPRPT